MQEQESSTTRTDFAERLVEEFLSTPLVAEFVFRSPQKIHGTQREVADFLLLHQERGILVSQKCQEDPQGRDEKRTERWARKKAVGALSQLNGALRAATAEPIWAEHPRRGRVEFPNGLPTIVHAIVIVEVFQPVDLEPASADLPLHCQGAPITYLSVNDFLNLAAEMRTIPELLAYLEARRSLPVPELRVIGDEKCLLQFYLLNEASFSGCVGRADARVTLASQPDRLEEVLARKSESDLYSGILEHVADALATRNPNYAAGLSSDLVAAFEPSDRRSTYLEMQALLADLRLRERAELGRAFDECSTSLSVKSQGFSLRAAWLDSKPDWIYIFGASKNWERQDVLVRVNAVMRGALAFYDKPRCLLVIDRDGNGYEAAISPAGFRPTLTDAEIGRRVFGRLRVTENCLDLVVPQA
jgi:hypothetical protein